MKENSIQGRKRRRFIRTTDSNHNLTISPNLVDRKFDRQAPNQVWLSDITYLRTQAGWVYLATVMDGHTRKILGWSLADHMRTELVTGALEMGLGRANPPKGLLIHSDRGSQYASEDYRALIAKNGLIQSMSRKGNCWDNALMESFFDSLKTEHVYHEQYEDLKNAKAKIFQWIEVFYNRERIHSSLGYLSPSCFEARNLAKAA